MENLSQYSEILEHRGNEYSHTKCELGEPNRKDMDSYLAVNSYYLNRQINILYDTLKENTCDSQLYLP